MIVHGTSKKADVDCAANINFSPQKKCLPLVRIHAEACLSVGSSFNIIIYKEFDIVNKKNKTTNQFVNISQQIASLTHQIFIILQKRDYLPQSLFIFYLLTERFEECEELVEKVCDSF